MLYSEKKERQRHFKLALRAILPILVLLFLVIYHMFLKGKITDLNLENNLMIVALIFVSVYFIFFFIARSAKESLVDQVTQIFTEKAFVEQLEEYKPQSLSLLIIQNLSSINENYSTFEIDAMLYRLVNLLNHSFERAKIKNPLMGRRYGAEFLIALQTNGEQVEQILSHFIATYPTINNIELDYRYSIITNTDIDFCNSLEQLRSLIDMEDREKNEGTKRDDSFVQDAKELSRIEHQVIEAIEKKALILSFRPLLHVRTQKTDIYEVAVRLKISQKESVLPRVFLPIVNRLGLGRKYDIVLMEHLTSLLPLIDEDISFTFNISPFSLRDVEFRSYFFELLKNAHINPSRLIIQLYEKKAHHNLEGYLKILREIRTQGVRVCIDNFGASNASMEYMKHFTFDMIQFDRDFVNNLEEKSTHAMLASMVKMSKDLEIITVAKWVDQESQKQRLKTIGIDYIQGFGVAKPLNKTAIIKQYNQG